MSEKHGDLYVEVSGCNCRVGNLRGVTTGFTYGPGRTAPEVSGAFVKLDEGSMLYVRLDREPIGERGTHRQIASWYGINRDEFDRLNSIDTMRTELGWRT